MLFHVGLTGGFENCQPRLISWGWSIQKAHRTERLQTFAYDAFGNKAVTAGVQNGQPNHTPTALSQFNTHNQWSTACSTPPCYDAGGNQTLVAGDVYTYDGENRIASANAQNMGATTYGYDGFGHRIWKSNAVGMTVYAYDAGGELTAEYSNTPTTVTGTEYMSADHLGSTRVITDASGNLVRRYDYVPFGQEIASGIDGRGSDYGSAVYPAAQDFQSKKFTGKERDAESGLDYFEARYFSGAQGRFTSSDPKQFPHDLEDPQSWNKYGYTRDNPLRYTDPDGRDWKGYVVGALNAFGSDNALGAGRTSGGNTDFKTGQSIGDAVATVTGTLEALTGGGEALVTAPAALTGVGVLLPAAGAAVAAQGFTTAAVAGGHLASTAFADNNQQSSGGLNKSATGRGSVPSGQRDPKRTLTPKEKVEKLAEQGGDCAHCGTPIKGEKGEAHHDPERHADGGSGMKLVHEACHDSLHCK